MTIEQINELIQHMEVSVWMAEVRVTMKKGERPERYVSVSLTVNRSDVTRVASHLGDRPQSLYCLDGAPIPYIAVEAACYSGAFFILQRMHANPWGDAGYTVTVISASGLTERDTTPYAIAADIGVAIATGHKDLISTDSLMGWQIVEATSTTLDK